MAARGINESVRYEPEENPPPLVAIGSDVQAAILIVAPVVLTVVIVGRIAEQPDSYISWAIFAALLVSGATTVLQAVRFGRLGSGHVLIMGTSGAFIAVCVAALVEGGPTTMALLIVVSSLFQFGLAARLSLLRRIFTPTVAGTVIMLITATVIPLVFAALVDVPEGSESVGGPAAAGVALLVTGGLLLRGAPAWRLWAPVMGIAAGCVTAAFFGLYDAQPVLDAPWVGVPFGGWPGFERPGAEFWALLPAFVVVTLVGAVETIGDGVAIQHVSRRTPRATDFRVVQGALNADGMGNLLSGIAGTMPNTTYSTSISLAEITGMTARRVGLVIGVVIAAVAFFPKIAALLIGIPGPVAAAYLLMLLALLFVQGMKIIVLDGVDHRKATVVGVAFWLGVGFQNQAIFPSLLTDGFVGVLLSNGMTAGALAAILMMVFMEVTGRRRQRLAVSLDAEALPALTDFLRSFASKAGWDAASTESRLVLVGEETFASLLEEDTASEGERRRLIVTAQKASGGVELEFVSASAGEENLEDRLSYLGETPDIADVRETSFRLLRGYASSVRHQKYYDVDIVTLRVEKPR